MFLVALGLFAAASLLGGVVSGAGLLIAARFVMGMAAAVTAPAGLSLLTTTLPEGPMRNRAISIYSAFGASGFSLGLVLSGVLTEVSWRWTLLLPALSLAATSGVADSEQGLVRPACSRPRSRSAGPSCWPCSPRSWTPAVPAR